MRMSTLVPFAAAIALGACGQSDDKSKEQGGATKPGIENAANIAGADADFRVEPGQYRSKVNITKMDLGGLPAQVAAAMPRERTFEYCVSAEDAAKGIEALKKQVAEGRCQFESFHATAGKMDSVFTCAARGGFAMRAVSRGNYAANSSDVVVTADADMPGGHKMHIEQTVKAERIGECSK